MVGIFVNMKTANHFLKGGGLGSSQDSRSAKRNIRAQPEPKRFVTALATSPQKEAKVPKVSYSAAARWLPGSPPRG
jgi:hypothetical protein